MFSRHDGAIEPGIIDGAEESLADTLGGSADRSSRGARLEEEDSFCRDDVAVQGCKSDFGCHDVSGLMA